MKRQKSKSFSPGSFQADVRNKKGKSPYVFDKKLLPRLRQFLGEYGTGNLPSLDEAVHYLQGKYGEYGRRKKTVFKNSVQKEFCAKPLNIGTSMFNVVYQAIRNESAEEKKLQELEERFLGKRKHPEDFLPIDVESDEEGLVVSSDSECTDDESRAVLQNGNLVNKSMYVMYRTSSFRQNSDEENEESLDINIPIENTSNSSPRTPTLEVRNNGTASEEISVKERFLSTNGFSNNDSTSKTDPISTSGDVSRSDNVSRTNYSVSDSVSKNCILGYSPISVMAGSDLTVVTTDTLRSEHSFKENNTPEIKNKRPADVSSQGSSAKERKKNRRSEDTKKRKRNEHVLEDNAGNIPAVPSLRFSDLGGCSETIQEVCKLLIHIKHPEVFKALGITPPRGFLLHGPPGCGKTLLAHAIAGELEVPLINVASTEMVSGLSGESEGKIRDLFTRATVHTPCVLFLDEIDAITPKRETASKEMERRIVAQLLACLDDLNRNQEAQVVVIGATNRPDSLDPALRRAGRFDREIRMGIPDEQAREQILQVQCKDLKLSGEFDFKTIARQTPGFVGADLMALAREAAMCAVTRIFHCLEWETVSISSVDSVTNTNGHKAPGEISTLNIMAWLKSNQVISEEKLTSLSIGMDDFTKALQDVQPSAKREGFATIPDVTWNDIGALEDIREELTMAIIAPVRHREAFTELGLTNPPGILLAGPPGCGKTLLAKAIANESGINFISVKGPELLNMYVGESERAVRQVFQRARNSAPCVIFFDELDALCPRRSDSSESNASARVVNQLLTEMDGLETRKQVFIMGATNRPDIIDPAILRPGRLDKVLYVGLPREKDRLAILQTITKRGTRPRLLEDVDLMAIASDEHCHGFSGADLAALVREASVNALRERMKLSTTKDSGMAWQPGSTNQDDSEAEAHGTSLGVASRHFDQAFTKIKPSVSEKEQVIYQYMKEQIRTDKPQ